MITEQLSQIIFWCIIIGGITGFGLYLIGVVQTKNRIKKMLIDSAENPKTNPLVVKAFLDIVFKIFGDNDESLRVSTYNKLFVQLMRDGEVYFKTGDFETSQKCFKETYEISRTQEQMDEAFKYQTHAEAMIKFEQAKRQLNVSVDPLKIMVLLEEAKTLADDYEIPGYVELKAKVLEKINEVHGKSSE